MNTKSLEKHFGGRDKAMSALGIYRQLWDHWAAKGIPMGRQYQIQIETGGALKADAEPRKATA